MRKSKTTRQKAEDVKLTASSFEALPDAEKNRILAEIEGQTSEERLAQSRPLNANERAQWSAFRKKATRNRSGRPKIGKGSRVISLSVEAGMLKQVDAYVKQHGLGRSELFVKALGILIGTEK